MCIYRLNGIAAKNSPKHIEYAHHSGGILMLWIIVEFYIWGFSGLSVAYGIFAVCQIANAVIFIHTRVL
jgi:hypothetical protein